MALRLSTGTTNKLLDTGSFKSIFTGCWIDIYTGTQPASADNAASGTLLATITADGLVPGAANGLTFADNAASGSLSKSTQTWSCASCLASGTAGWFRVRENTDSGTGASSTAARIDGAISTSGAQMNLGSLTVTQSAPFVLSAASFTLPSA